MNKTVFLIIFMLTACSAESPDSSIEEPRARLENAKKNVANLSERLARASETCEHGSGNYDPNGELALAEVDVAMADNIDSISPAQEQRIRESLGAEMGLAPSQVDGWKSIYRSRAEKAKRLLANAEVEKRSRQKEACDYLPELKRLLVEAEASTREFSKL